MPYPNPFWKQCRPTTIRYLLSEDAHVGLDIYTYLGDRVWNANFNQGDPGGQGGKNGKESLIMWNGIGNDGRGLPAGGYILNVQINAKSGRTVALHRKLAISWD